MRKFYRVLATDSEVKVAFNLYLKVFERHGELIVKITDSISNGNTDIDNKDFEKLTETLTEYYGISKSTLSYIKRHPDENTLTDESINSLKYIIENYSKAKSSMEFIQSQLDQALFLKSLDQPSSDNL